MKIEATLTKDLFFRLSLLRHFQRIHFYFWAITAAGLTAFAFVQGPLILLLVAWTPFVLYVLLGVITAMRNSNNEEHPIFLTTKYEFSKKGVFMSSTQGQSQLNWDQFASWKTIADCFVLVLTSGAIMAIPRNDVPGMQQVKLEELLNKHIAGRA